MPVPAPGRTVYLPAAAVPVTGELRWPDKAPADLLGYTLDATNFLADAGGDTIAAGTASIASAPADLTFGTLSATPTSLTWPISGGVLTSPVTDHAIAIAFSTAGGLTLTRTVWMRINVQGPNQVFGTDVVVVKGDKGDPGAPGSANLPAASPLLGVSAAGTAVTVTLDAATLALTGPAAAPTLQVNPSALAALATTAALTAETAARAAADALLAPNAALAAEAATRTSADTTLTTNLATATATANAALPAAQKGAASGVATLDAGSLVPGAQIPFGSGAAQVPTNAALAAVSAVANSAATNAALSAEATARTSADTTLTTNLATATATANAALPAAQKGAASGVATLDAGSLVPGAQIPFGSGAAQVPTNAALAAVSAVANSAATNAALSAEATARTSADTTLTTNLATATATANAALPAAQKGAASGVATLDAGSLVPGAQIPFGVGATQVPTNAALTNAAVASGSISAGGSLSLLSVGGATIPVAGIVGVTAATIAVANTGVGGAAKGTGTITAGTLALSLSVPSVQGPTGGVATIGTPKGGWNPVTNTPALATGGAGGVAGDTYLITTSGTLGTAIDGIVSVQQFGALTNLGTSWLYVTPASVSGAVQTLFLPNATLLDDGSGVPGFAIVGKDGGSVFRAVATGVDMGVARIGTATITNLIAPNFTAPPANVLDSNGNTLFSAGANTVVLGGAAVTADSAGGGFRLLTSDGYGITTIDNKGNIRTAGHVISIDGTLTPSGAAATVFTAQDIANIDAIGLASSARVKTRSNTTAMRGTAQYNMQMVVGQSRTVGTYGSPPLSTTQPLDVLMLGTCTRGVPKLTTDSTIATFTTIGDTLFHPAIAVGQVNGSAVLTTPRTGFFANISNVTVSGSSDGTISWAAQTPAIDATTVFTHLDTFQCQGFTVATGNNANPSNANVFTVKTVTASSINFNEIPVATVSPESGITIAQVAYKNYGEDPSLVANNEYRKQQLNARGVLADPTRLNVVSIPGIAVVVPGQMTSCYGITPNPYYFNRIDGAMRQVKATAASGGNGYPAGTSCLQSVYVAAGGDESGSGVSKADFRGQLGTWLNSIVADAYTVFGATQTAPPFVYSFVVGSLQLSDGRNPSAYVAGNAYAQFNLATNAGNVYVCSTAIPVATTPPIGNGVNITDGAGAWNYLRATPAVPDRCPIPKGTLELFGCSPSTGYPFNYPGVNPNWYIAGPEYYSPDRGAHGSATAYQWTGCQIAKVRTKVEIYGQGWLPCHILQPYVRGVQILISLHAPEPPIQVRSPFLYDTPLTYPDFGFAASDVGGSLTIVTAALAGQTCVLLTCNRTVDPATLVLSYADSAHHSGNGMICDSDPWQPALTGAGFTLGSGQLLTDNLTAPVASPGPTIQVGQPFPLWNWLCPDACPGIAY